ncbi:hypothetical protein EDD11_005312 [Mortierella claussenii]|nr:hypothetical protein EDD11_005312 [Mortierella claussenii]
MSGNNNGSTTKETDASVSTFLSSIIFTSVVSAGLILVFTVVRVRYPRVYAPKTYMGPKRERPDPSINGILGWVFGPRNLNELEFVERCGLDAYMFIEFLNKSFFLFLGFAFLAIPILIPLNTTNQLNLVGLNQLTIANIADQKRLWAHVILTVLFCGATLAVAMYSVRRYITRRQRYLMSDHHAQSLQATTILVCGIPKGEDNLESLHDIFSVFPGGVKRIWLAYAAPDLQKDINKRTVTVNKLEAAECALIKSKLKHHIKTGRRASQSSINPVSAPSTNQQQQLQQQQLQVAHSDESFPPESRPKHRPIAFPLSLFSSCYGGQKVDSVQTYRSELSNMNASIMTRQQAGMTTMRESQDENKMRAAFIQFNHQLGAHLATQSVVHRKTLTMEPRYLEVHPKDVLWDNLNYGLKARNVRRTIAILLATALIVFWTIPVAFVSSVAKLDAIVKFAPFLSGVYSLPKVVVGIIQGLLPPIGLAVLMMILPIILYKLAHFGGEVLSTRKTLTVITSYHWFSVVHVLLVTTLANGIFAAVEAIKENPNNVMTMLSSTLPQASTFFLSFILLSMIQIPVMLLQIGPLIMYIIGKRMSSTPRKMFATESNLSSVDWGTTIPVHTIAFSIGLLYSTIQPIILPFVAIYFGLYYLAFRYMFLYVYRQPFDSGGLIFPRIVDQMYIGVILFEVVMLGLFVLQKAIGQSIVMFVMLVLSLLAIFISRENIFKLLIQYLPVQAFDSQSVQLSLDGNLTNISSASQYGNESGASELALPRHPAAQSTATTTSKPTSIRDKSNHNPTQESFHEKASFKEPLSPGLEPASKEIYPPDHLKSLKEGLVGVGDQGHRRQESNISSRSQSSLPSVRVEGATTHDKQSLPTSTITTGGAHSSAPSGGSGMTRPMGRGGHLSCQDSDCGGAGTSSTLQVLGADHSLMSASDPKAERVVPELLAYVNPALWRQCQPLWLPKDPRGFAEVEIVELNNAGLHCTTDSATMDTKQRIAVEVGHREVAPGEELWE